MNDCYCILFILMQGESSGGGGEGGEGRDRKFYWEDFLPGKGILGRSDFEDSNLFQS